MLEWLKNPAVVALVSGIPALATLVLGYRRSTRAAQHAAASEQHAAASEGWRELIGSLRAENQELRKQVAALLEERRSWGAVPRA